MALYYRDMQDREKEMRDEVQLHHHHRHHHHHPAAAFLDSKLVSPVRTGRRDCSHLSPENGKEFTLLSSPPPPPPPLVEQDQEDAYGAPIARHSPPVPVPMYSTSSTSPSHTLISPAADSHLRKQQQEHQQEGPAASSPSSMPPPRRKILSESTPTRVPQFIVKSKVDTGAVMRRPLAGDEQREPTARERVLQEEAEARRAKRRSTSPFRSTSPRFGTRPAGGASTTASYDAACYIRPLESTRHECYVPVTTFDRTRATGRAASPSGRDRGGGDERLLRRDSSRGASTLMERAPARFGEVLYHGDGMVSPRLDSPCRRSPARNFDRNSSDASLGTSGSRTTPQGSRQPRFDPASPSTAATAASPSATEHRPPSPPAVATSTTAAGRGRPRSPRSVTPKRSTATTRTADPTSGSGSNQAGEKKQRPLSPLSPHILLRPRTPKRKHISVMAGAPPRFGGCLMHGKGLISPVPAQYH